MNDDFKLESDEQKVNDAHYQDGYIIFNHDEYGRMGVPVNEWLNDKAAVNNLLDDLSAPSAEECNAGWGRGTYERIVTFLQDLTPERLKEVQEILKDA